MMPLAAIPLSNVSLIALMLGAFFLVIAFYKKIFHKRTPTGVDAKEVEDVKKPAKIVTLSAPFQQAQSAPDANIAEQQQNTPGADAQPAQRQGGSLFNLYTPGQGRGDFGRGNDSGANQRYVWE